MPVSVFDLFKIGIGPSSSHTVGPMKAARRFVQDLADRSLLGRVDRISAELFGSLALTGRGHGSDRAVILGLMGCDPEDVPVDLVASVRQRIAEEGHLKLLGRHEVAFQEARDLLFRFDQTLPRHPNGLRFAAFGANGESLSQAVFYSVGGGFVVADHEFDRPAPLAAALPYPYRSARELLEMGKKSGLTIAQMARANEESLRPPGEVADGLNRIWSVMQNCVERGLAGEGVLLGGLGTKRRAAHLRAKLDADRLAGRADPLAGLEWVNAFALAVSEENAAGGRIVTAPTNGAAGIVPAVLYFMTRFLPHYGPDAVSTALLAAGAIGSLYKENASISGAEVGCQGEVGVACSMAAAGLAAAAGGTNAQVENAAEIGMEHHLGLTCDPIGGLVQVPCIERNAIAAATAINAARMSLSGDGSHLVSLDMVIETMRQTGADMQEKYKETSLGGLAANQIEC